MKWTCCECTADDDIQEEEESRDGDVHGDDNKETIMFMTMMFMTITTKRR
jgi:hypothetical protein